MSEYPSELEAAIGDLRWVLMVEVMDRQIEGPAYNRLLGQLDIIDKLAAELRQERDYYGAQFIAAEGRGDIPCEF